jgi:hypothetical protein
VKHLFTSVVVDLSGIPAAERPGYVKAAQHELETLRAASGLPHWIIIDEAQVPLARDGSAATFFEPAAGGHCLVTHRTEDLRPEALLAVDVVIALPGSGGDGQIAGLLAAAGGLPNGTAAALARQAGPGQAVLVDRSRPNGATVFAVGQRQTSHMRHWHKYSAGWIRPDRRFYFRRDWDTATGATAGSIAELEHELGVCDDEVIRHHCRHADLSRWISDVLGDPPLAAAVRQVETALGAGTISITEARTRLTEAIHRRYQQ